MRQKDYSVPFPAYHSHFTTYMLLLFLRRLFVKLPKLFFPLFLFSILCSLSATAEELDDLVDDLVDVGELADSVVNDPIVTENNVNRNIDSNTNSSSDKTASLLFANLREQVYQIRVIDIASGDKFTIGSGFQISAEGHIATNFHVVSPFVHEPKKYRLEFASFDESVASAELLAVDVVHDLAILHADGLGDAYIPLKSGELKQGDRIYSMGNPRDLGMTIIEGTYNGFVQTSRYQKILFSGSLNAGMSGGPAVDANGEVVGINVSKGGEQLSFLVPVDNLATLVVNLPNQIAERELLELTTDSQAQASAEQIEESAEEKASGEFDKIIRDALLADQVEFYHGLLERPVELEALGELKLPAKLSDALKCWGHTVDQKEDNKYAGVHQHCRLEDQIYIKDSFYVGDFFYDYEWITSTELNQLQFYNFLQTRFNHSRLSNVYDKEHVTNYQCQTNFINLTGHSWKVSTCFRAYKRYLGLYDAILLMASVDEKDKAAVITMGASGIDRENAMALFKRMTESVQWSR